MSVETWLSNSFPSNFRKENREKKIEKERKRMKKSKETEQRRSCDAMNWTQLLNVEPEDQYSCVFDSEDGREDSSKGANGRISTNQTYSKLMSTTPSQLKRVDFKVGLKFATPEIQASDLTDGAEYEVAKRGPGLPGGTL